MTPTELAAELRMTPKALRSWLRVEFPRSSSDEGARWDLKPAQVAAARDRFRRRPPTTSRDTQRVVGSSATVPDSFPTRLQDFLAAPMFTREEVLASPCPVPQQAGVYGWWFSRVPGKIRSDGCVWRDHSCLLYTGISPKRPPANGRPPSTQSLRARIKYHLTGNAEGSTLRKTLGSLLSGELDIELRRVGSGSRMTFVEGERALSAWMSEHARVSWIVDGSPWLLEAQIISNVDVPLNLDGNKHNAFYPELVDLRAKAVARARALPVIPNRGVGGR